MWQQTIVIYIQVRTLLAMYKNRSRCYKVHYLYVSCTCSIWGDMFLLYTVTDQNITFLLPLLHVLPVEVWEASCKAVHFLLTGTIKTITQEIIV